MEMRVALLDIARLEHKRLDRASIIITNMTEYSTEVYENSLTECKERCLKIAPYFQFPIVQQECKVLCLNGKNEVTDFPIYH